MTDIYRAELLDISKKCFLLLKHARSRKIDFGLDEKSGNGTPSPKAFLVDKIGLRINPKGEVLLVSSTLTVFRVESEEDSDSFSVDSLELSQKQREFGDEYAEYGATNVNESRSNEKQLQGNAAESNPDKFKYLTTSLAKPQNGVI